MILQGTSACSCSLHSCSSTVLLASVGVWHAMMRSASDAGAQLACLTVIHML
jgi:hypothetical protein